MDALSDTLWQEFAVETEEHLQAVEPILVAADPEQTGAADIAQLFRSFHSIKGLSRAMEAPGMESLAHHAENLLGLVRDGRASLSHELADLLLQSVDALKRMRAAVSGGRRDAPPDQDLVARLVAAFERNGSDFDGGEPSGPGGAADAEALHPDPEMLAIFVEMMQARGPELCGALSNEHSERDAAFDAAQTLAHASEVMNFEALVESFGGLRDALQRCSSQGSLDEAARRELLTCLGDIRLRIELVAEITGQDAGCAAFSAALAWVIGDARYRLALTLVSYNQRLRDDLNEPDHLAAEADATEMVRTMRTLYATLAALSMKRAAEALLLAEDLFGRVATGEIDPPEMLLAAADALFWHLTDHAKAGRTDDIAESEAAEFNARLREPVASIAQQMVSDEGPLVAGLYIPAELLAVLTSDKRAEIETGIGRGERAYEILAHLEAEPATAESLIGWLTGEAALITNRTVLQGGESWLAFLVLSPLAPAAVVEALLARDPQRRCVKSARRLTDAVGGEAILERAEEPEPDGAAGLAAPIGVPSNLIRVRGEIVDAFLDDIGELRVTAASLNHLIRGVGSRALLARVRAFTERLPSELRSEFHATFHDFRERDRRLLETEELISRMLSRLHQGALELRVVPIDVVFNRLPRMVRDLAQQLGKTVELSLEGRDVRIDKSMVEALADPLIHLIRNAVDHGIEPSDERRAAGKSERAHLRLRAAQRGSEIYIEIADDGRGLDCAAIRATAVARGLIAEDQAAGLLDAEVSQLIFAPGLSTAATVTETSGRGVGLDIVLATVRRLDGDISVRSERGRGTTFSLVLPVSAALQTALIVRLGDQSLAIPERHVMAVTEVERQSVRLVGSQRSILYRQAVLPLFGLGDVLGMPNGVATAQRAFDSVVVVGNGRQMIGLEVDAIERRQELFLKDLDPRLASFPGVGGASVLGDGRVILVLDGEAVLQLAARGAEPAAAAVQMAS